MAPGFRISHVQPPILHPIGQIEPDRSRRAVLIRPPNTAEERLSPVQLIKQVLGERGEPNVLANIRAHFRIGQPISMFDRLWGIAHDIERDLALVIAPDAHVRADLVRNSP